MDWFIIQKKKNYCIRSYNKLYKVLKKKNVVHDSEFIIMFNNIWMLTFSGGDRYGGRDVSGGPPDVRVRADAECRGGQ